MVLNLHPKCANPSCAASFEWMAGGRMFRFRRDSRETLPGGGGDAAAGAAHPIGHFWLCERCSNIYMLRHEPGRGVMIHPLWPELPPAKNDMHLPAS